MGILCDPSESVLSAWAHPAWKDHAFFTRCSPTSRSVARRGYTMSVWTCRCALLTSLYLFLPSATVSPFELTLLHTNDNHARIEETSEDSGKCSERGPCFAGVARRLTKVSEIRRKEKNVLFLDAGDQFQGTVWFNYYKGAEAAHFMNKLGYDAMVNMFLLL